MWRRLFKPFGADVVMTVDYDGEVRIRFAKYIGNGRYMCKGIYSPLLLCPGGRVEGRTYVKTWFFI